MLTQRFEVAQIPFNLVNTEPEEELIPLALRLNMGFIAMKPLAGGALENAVLAFRYLSQFPSVVPDPGIERVEEMEEILRVMENVRPLTPEETDAIERIRKELGKVFCRRCDYCQPCPEEIPIASVLSIESAVKRAPLKDMIRWGLVRSFRLPISAMPSYPRQPWSGTLAPWPSNRIPSQPLSQIGSGPCPHHGR